MAGQALDGPVVLWRVVYVGLVSGPLVWFAVLVMQMAIYVNLVPVMKVEVHRQRRRRMCGVYEENVCSRSKSARGERVLSDYTSLVMRRYAGITLGFRFQGVEQFV